MRWALLVAVFVGACASDPPPAAPDAGPSIDAPADEGAPPPAPDVASGDVAFDAQRSSCRDDEDCRGNKVEFGRYCSVAAGRCVPCVPERPETCPAGQYCSDAFRCLPGCANDAQCAGSSDGPRCNLATHRCARCVEDRHCDPVAGAGVRCADGRCVSECLDGLRDCDGAPANGCETAVTTTIAHCGACNNPCPTPPNADPRCATGRCAFDCREGFGDCNGDPTDGCEVDLRTSNVHCGACRRACAVGERCTAGACVSACEAPRAVCRGACVDVRTDVSHCGRCDAACVAPNGAASCRDGACAVASCDAGFGDCDGSAANGCEADLRVSSTHCGACGMACGTTPNAASSCAGGACRFECAAGFADCDGAPANGCEVDTRSSVTHCGGCGTACAPIAHANVSCAVGRCASRCDAGYGDCDGVAATGCETDTRTTAAHCGACGNACGAGATCVSGVCQYCPSGQIYCAGRCFDPSNDHGNCGTCGRNCLDGMCVAGACTPFLMTVLPTPRAVNLAYDGTFLYTAGHTGEPIYRIRADTPGSPEPFVTPAPYTLSLHVADGRLYWCSYAEPTLFSVPLAGGAIATAPLPMRSGEFLLEADTVVSVNYAATASEVRRSRRDTGAVTSLGTIPDFYGAAILRGLSGELLFGTQAGDTIWRIPASGGALEVAYRLGATRDAEQLVSDGRYYYATSPSSGEILRIDPTTGSVTSILRWMNQPWGLVVTTTMIFFTTYFGHDVWAMVK